MQASTHEEEGADCGPGEDGLMRVHLAYLLRPCCAYQQQVGWGRGCAQAGRAWLGAGARGTPAVLRSSAQAALAATGAVQALAERAPLLPRTRHPHRIAHSSQVLHVAHLAREQLAAGRSPAQPCDPAALAGLLADCGYTVTLREAVRAWGSRRRGCPIFTRLPHRFIVVTGRGPASCATAACSGGGSGACSELLIDPAFRSHFELARATPRYRALLALLPRLFVGPAWQLRELVDWLSR